MGHTWNSMIPISGKGRKSRMSHKRFDYTLIPGQRLLIYFMCSLTELGHPSNISFPQEEFYSATTVLPCNVLLFFCVCVSVLTDSTGQGICLCILCISSPSPFIQ